MAFDRKIMMTMNRLGNYQPISESRNGFQRILASFVMGINISAPESFISFVRRKTSSITAKKVFLRMGPVHRAFCLGKKRICPALLTFVLLWIILYISGWYIRIIEKDLDTEFSYPLEGDVGIYVQQLLAGKEPAVSPFNHYNHALIHGKSCDDKNGKPHQIRLLLVVKSAVDHFDRRKIIRKTWGWEKRFSDVAIQCVFILGTSGDKPYLQKLIDSEQRTFNDIIQFDFHDSYFNNTIKTMLGFKWVVTKCSSSKYVMFSDDDMYVSIKNVLKFLRNPKQYSVSFKKTVSPSNKISNDLNISERDEEIDSLLAGRISVTYPMRDIFSKWYISYDEYPYSMFPPFLPAGAYIMSTIVTRKLYFTSMYTKHFRFDDVYIGILAKKANTDLFHVENIYIYKKDFDENEYKYVIAAHGFGDPTELLEVWSQQKSLGNS